MVIAAMFALAFCDAPLPAQTPPAKDSSGRYLFIVDTSAAMRRRAPAAQKAVSNLLLSSMHAQLRRGDTIGVWTYNEQLYAGHLPLQRWTPEDEQLIASNILAFIKTQPFEKKSRLDPVWPALQSVVRESDRLTVLLISDGSEKISSTPFDREINKFFKTEFRAQQKARMPFVTVLRSRRGEFTGATLNLAPWPVEFPPEPKVVAAPKPQSPPEKTAPRPAAPPLIVIGEKPEPAFVAPAAPSEPTPAKPAPTGVAPAPVQPAAPTPTAAPTEAAPPPVVAKVQPKPDVLPVAVPPAEPVVEPKPPAAELPKPVPTPVVTTPETKPTSPPVITPPTEPSHASTPPPVPPPAHADGVKPEPSPPPAAVKQPPTTPPVQVATATQPETFFSRTNLVLIGLGLLVLAGAVYFLVQRRARATAHASLITRSMDQDKK